MSEQLDAVLRRMGYVHRDHAAGQDVELHTDRAADRERAAYPQVVMIQGHSTRESWVRDHAGQLILAAGIGVFGLAALAVVALVVIVIAVALVVITASVTILGRRRRQPGSGKAVGPMTPTPRRPGHRDQGYADGSLLRTLTMICFISLVLSGLIVYWIGEITPPQPGDRPPTAHPSHQPDHRPPAGNTTPAGQRPAPARKGGDGCG